MTIAGKSVHEGKGRRLVLASPVEADTQDDTEVSQDASKKAKRLETVTVTGSLIPTAQIETSTPTFQITADDIKAQGFMNVAEALRALPQASGAVLSELVAELQGGHLAGLGRDRL